MRPDLDVVYHTSGAERLDRCWPTGHQLEHMADAIVDALMQGNAVVAAGVSAW